MNTKTHRLPPLVLLVVILICRLATSISSPAQDDRAAPPAAKPSQTMESTPTASTNDPPIQFVVLLVIAQLRADCLTRFAPLFRDRGFRRLTRNGADFRNAYLSYGSAATAPGHSSIITGRLPRQHGVVGNRWFLDPASDKPSASIDDDDCKLVGATGKSAEKGGKSSRALIGIGLGDQLKISDRRSRVFSLAWRDRAAI